MVLSEFGGYSYKPEGHVFNVKETYGYRFFKEREAFEDLRIERPLFIRAVKCNSPNKVLCELRY